MEFRKSDGEVTIVYPTLPGKGANAAMHVALCMGGPSAENDVSRTSAKRYLEALETLGYTVTPVDIGRDFGAVLPSLQVDVVVNATHGEYGEDGCLPGLLELAGVPYTHSGVLASAVAMNKIFSRGFFTMNDIPVAPAVVVQREQNIISDPMPRPYVIKPPHMGSSVGVQVVFADSPFSFATFDWEFGDTMLVERYIPGREVQVGILDGQALCVGEILTKNSFHDYASKYEAGIAVHIVPAVLPQHVADKMMEVALKIHTLLNCRSVSRVDFRYDDTTPGKEEFFVLEINTHPGCTPFSLYPELAEAAGVSFEQMVDRVVKSARCDLLHKKDMKSKAIAKIAAI